MQLPLSFISFFRRVAHLPCGLWLACLGIASTNPAMAQGNGRSDPRGAYMSRPALEAQAAVAERKAADPGSSEAGREHHRGEAWLLRHRLDQGDFAPGDRIVVTVAGEPALSDTFAVHAGPSLSLGNLPSLPLTGVLRSEIEAHLASELGTYLHQPEVRAVPLLRIAVMGPVGRPGFYHFPADMPLTDVIMAAGGPGNSTDLKRARIRRGGETLYRPRDVTIAFADGMSLDMLSLRGGDELLLTERRRINWFTVVQVASLASGLIGLVWRFTS